MRVELELERLFSEHIHPEIRGRLSANGVLWKPSFFSLNTQVGSLTRPLIAA